MPFSIGDVVHPIAYPSHRMTVVEVDGYEITCRWFEGAAVKEGISPVRSLAREFRPKEPDIPAQRSALRGGCARHARA